MREKSGTSKTGSRTRTSLGVQQRPARRDRGDLQSKEGSGFFRGILEWIPRAVKIGLSIAFLVLIFAGYRAAASAAFFQVHSIDVTGADKASADQVRTIVRKVAGPTGVWSADLAELTKEIGQLAWVRTVVVSRVLPDGFRVRVTERKPSAVAHLTSGRFVWVDDEAAVLGELQPSDKIPDFFIRGWTDGSSPEARAENLPRIQKFNEITRDFSAGGMSSRVSEVDLADLSDVRVQLSGDDADISVRLGKEDLANHLRGALKRLDEARHENNGYRIIYVDNSLGSRITLGTDHQIVRPTSDSANSAQPVHATTPTAATTGAGVKPTKPVTPATGKPAQKPNQSDSGKKKPASNR